jgi:hypothetical protein
MDESDDGTRRFITTFTSAHHLFLSWARSTQALPPNSASWTSILILILPSAPRCSKWSLSVRSPKLFTLEGCVVCDCILNRYTVPTGLSTTWICQLKINGMTSFTDWLRTGRSGVRILVGTRFFAHVQTVPGTHPAYCTMGTGSFPGVNGRGVVLTTHPLLAPRSWVSMTISLLPLLAFGACYRANFTLPQSQEGGTPLEHDTKSSQAASVV